MIIAIVPFVALIIGVLLLATVSKHPWPEIGRALTWCSILVLLLVLAHHTVKL
jgi:hypothetical protein